MREILLTNGIKTCIKKNNDTPRTALALNFSIQKPEKFPGEYLLMNRLLLKGTEKYTSEELSGILDENAIDMYTEMKYDYLRFRFVSLNEDFEYALSILSDIIQNSTFEEFEKEREKLKGELNAELDSARSKVSDLFTKTIYKNHFYGASYTTILAEIDKVTPEDVKSAYKEILENSKKTLVFVGDADSENVTELLNKYLGTIPGSKDCESEIPVPRLLNQEYTELIKEDAQQAQIIQGWLVPTVSSPEYPAIALMNTILGASGLSSRLFLELRDKKGLAYTVRSAYRSFEKSALFHIYIGTEPKNVEVSLNGSMEEINKIKTIPVSEEELEAAKNNILGRQQFISETNSQQANISANYAMMGLGFDFQPKLIEKIKTVTPQMIMDAANKFLNNKYVIAIIRP